jgi:uncharacterized radical SAM protein YgiQ
MRRAAKIGPRTCSAPALPVSLTEARDRGWAELDVVLVSGDAYVDHPAFAAAILGRVLEAAGFRVGVLSQPDWRSAAPFRALGKPRLFFGVTAGNVDSMIAHYTPRKRPRREDPYSPGGVAGRRPDRATTVYAHRCREAYGGAVPVVIGGIEASLRRLAHWDHWSGCVRPSILASSKADLLVYGMGERLILRIAELLRDGGAPETLRGLPSTCVLLGRTEALAPPPGGSVVELPSAEACAADPSLLAEVTGAVCRIEHGAEPRTLVQAQGDRLLVHAPPDAPPLGEELDRWLALPFTRREHPSLPAPVPALETVRWSVVTHRGCFGGCSFCSLAEHQGRTVVSRSRDAVLAEVRALAASPGFSGTISDLGGPSANMYGLSCRRAADRGPCRRRSCLWPSACRDLDTDPGPWLELLRAARGVAGVSQVRVSSGVRMDLLLMHPEALRELVASHVGGQLKVAPEHDGALSLRAMRKYRPGTLRRFKDAFDRACRETGQRRFLVAYVIAGHPATTHGEMAQLAAELEELGLRPRQVQDFTPIPLTLSTAQHVSGRDPLTGAPTPPVRSDRDRDDQRAMLQWFLPQFEARGLRLLRLHGRGAPGSRPGGERRKKRKG